jgi:LCP family protein required for cell wall assembly
MSDDDQPPRPLEEIPEQTDDPIVWDPAQRRFVPTSERVPGAAAAPPRDTRKYFIGADAVGIDLPSQPGTPPGAKPATAAPAALVPAPGAASAPAAATPAASAPSAPVGAAPAAPARAPLPLPLPTPKPGAPEPERGKAPKAKRKRRRFLRIPKLRWILLFCSLLPVLLLAAGLWYANKQFHELHRVPVGAAIDSGGSGENILIVGSDSRDLQGIDPSETGITGDKTNPAPTGQRSDTMMILRLDSSGARMLSVPRDLIVTIADTGEKTRVNAAYNVDLGGGALRLIKTIKANLNIPINRYIEVDFATFEGVVDSIGGITVNFPNPAFDDNTGLNIQQAGDVLLNGEQSLEYVRSRHYTEIINGKKVEEPTADLGRIKRQQTFLTTVLGKIGRSHNPITLLQVGGEVVKGLRVDDKLGLFDAIRLAWDLKGVHPESVELPTTLNNDHATLSLKEPDADGVLATFR